MGLIGINYILNKSFLNYGVGAYGSIYGIRGGFFVGGINTSLLFSLSPQLISDTGIFVGGGGGGAAPQGGGLMLKYHTSLLTPIDKNSNIGVSYSRIHFPNGGIDSTKLGFVYQTPFDTFFIDSVPNSLPRDQIFRLNNDYMAPTFEIYYPNQGTLKTDTTPLDIPIKLVGFEYGRYYNNTLFFIETSGAAGGDSSGYMEVLAGGGYKIPLFTHLNLDARVSVGAGGGGRVKTDGGSLYKGSIGFNFAPLKNIYLASNVGIINSFEQNFSASYIKFAIGVNNNLISIGRGEPIDITNLTNQKYTIRLANQTYLPSSTLRVTTNEDAVQLIVCKLNYYFGDNFYISGQAQGAYNGDAGGYAVGFFGVGYELQLIDNLNLILELDAGASGGGGIQSGEGGIIQPMVGFEYKLNQKISFQALGGRIKSLTGALDTAVLDFSFSYRFDKLISF